MKGRCRLKSSDLHWMHVLEAADTLNRGHVSAVQETDWVDARVDRAVADLTVFDARKHDRACTARARAAAQLGSLQVGHATEVFEQSGLGVGGRVAHAEALQHLVRMVIGVMLHPGRY